MATVTVRLDDDVKTKFAAVCNELGMDMSTAVTVFAKKVVREQRIPFEVSADPFYGENNLAFLMQSIEQLKNGKVITKTMAELEAMANE